MSKSDNFDMGMMVGVCVGVIIAFVGAIVIASANTPDLGSYAGHCYGNNTCDTGLYCDNNERCVLEVPASCETE